MKPLDFEYARLTLQCKFLVRSTVYTVSGKRVERKYIALVDTESKLVIKLTDYADYVLYRVTKDAYMYKTSDNYMYAICQFLNYALLEQYDKYRITTIFDVSKDMITDYLNEYANTPIKSRDDMPVYPSMKSVMDKRAGISLFFEMLCHYHKDKMTHLKRRDLIHTHFVSTDRERPSQVPEYMIPIKYMHKDIDQLDQLIRDMPIDLADRILAMAELHDPELCFPIALQLYGGLREGEVCNVRRKESPRGPGIIIQSAHHQDLYGGTVIVPLSIEIDLTTEWQMRSDGKTVGGIKRERKVGIYGPFVDTVYEYYIKHLEITKHKPHEDFAPMFLSKHKDSHTGKYLAMTKASYVARVKKIFWDYVVPTLQSDPNPDLQLYYYQLRGHTWGLHAFRHWFTVYLLYSGVDDLSRLQDLRGDKNPHSAETYLKRKGVLMETYRKTVNKLGDILNGDNK